MIYLLLLSKINMSEDYGAAPFFGFMGVSLALVFASTALNIQILEPLTEQQRLEQEYQVSQFGNLQLL